MLTIESATRASATESAAVETAIRDSRAYLCYECGKCTSHCPISRFDPGFSPRQTMTQVAQGKAVEILQDPNLWSCLTCSMCETYCPHDVHYSEFTRQMRSAADGSSCGGWCSHGGALQSWMRMMTSPDLKQNRLDWIDEDLRVSEKGEYLYFVGCLPYFDAFFSDIEAASLDIARSTVRLLNAMGIEPVVLPDERCCGHDLLWEGDVDSFEKLGAQNIEQIRASGATKVIASCAECTRTLQMDYPEHFGKLDVEVVHLSELVAEAIESGELKLRGTDATVTYQDPCRLGRHLGVYDAPREVINRIPGVTLQEMTKNRKNAVCCGTSAWTNCDRHSKQIQQDRLNSARNTGADILVTACPKCAIHYKCTMSGNGSNEGPGIQIEDLGVLAARAL